MLNVCVCARRAALEICVQITEVYYDLQFQRHVEEMMFASFGEVASREEK